MMYVVLKNVKEQPKLSVEPTVVEIKGVVHAIGINDGIDKTFAKEEAFDNIQHLLTDEQKEVVENIFKLHGFDKNLKKPNED